MSTSYVIKHDAITEAEELALIEEIYNQPWRSDINRPTQHYGHIYNYQTTKVGPKLSIPLPPFIEQLRDRFYPSADQFIVNLYRPGEGITDHKDSPVFHDLVMSLSLGSDCLFYIDGKEILLKRRDLLIMNDRVTHGLRGRKTYTINGKRIPRDTRISITLRKVK
jgi:alkylated DNA repair dioxygenase AlkB